MSYKTYLTIATNYRGLSRLITEFLKNRVGRFFLMIFTVSTLNSHSKLIGRLRPDFLVRCSWDVALQACTGLVLQALPVRNRLKVRYRDSSSIRDGRRSFPSGHSSTAFAAMTLVSLLLAGKTAAWCFAKPAPPSSFLSSKLAAFTLSTIPLAYATWVAVSRVEDYVGSSQTCLA